MLEEIPSNIKAGNRERRWFASEQADLYIWQKPSGKINSFEYCYRNGLGENSIRWHERRGFEYACIDDGETSPFDNRTPISVTTGTPDWESVIKHFQREAQAVEVEVYRFVLHKLLRGSFAA